MTDDEIDKVIGECRTRAYPQDATTPYYERAIARAIIAAYQTNLLAGVGMPEVTRFDIDMDGSMEPHEDGAWVRAEVFFDRLQQYAAAAAAQAREKALDEAKRVCLSLFDLEDDSCNEAEQCAAAIDKLKGGE